ncbi:glycerophosphodiester phosphodiesterase [Phytoactinopolyspora mesophila]|uniref:Glycerophosphodiester phosphodiesterase n=1 Tax=Phytoactinopolyspora mesophila TaxID=2650750 RepID=A0A7K3M2I3_9ACTN|nr:glycerophosphodiester phosphodiesterase [Phytoactinopolyspora mesophila]NDL57513.1 glycerophosphodiester phosphodiesterase [Phytoactinopolyspora mesophila]
MTTPRLEASNGRADPIAFAHRGASAHAPENTLDAFQLALDMGATGLESDAWLSADGAVILDHDGVFGDEPQRTAAELPRAALPGHVPSLDELYATCGTGFELSLDVLDVSAFEPILRIAKAAGPDAVSRLWLCHPDWRTVRGWRTVSDDVRLVDSTRLHRIGEGIERRATTLASNGIDALNMNQADWTAERVDSVQQRGVLAFGYEAHTSDVLNRLIGTGVDAVYSDYVDRMLNAIETSRTASSSSAEGS